MDERSERAGRILADHGGRVFDAARRLGVSHAELVDFSSSINPLGPPPNVLAAIEASLTRESLRAYPDTHTLVAALSARHDVDPSSLVVGNGSAGLMFALMRAIRPARVLVLEPAFAEYSRAACAVGADTTPMLLDENRGFQPRFSEIRRAVEERRCDLVILNSPHNPTGLQYGRAALHEIVDAAEANGVAVLLDEAFVDYVGADASMIRTAATRARFVVLRSLTKFYAMAGLRVGYAACGAELASAIRDQIEAWPISTVALEAARAALDDSEFDERSVRANETAREQLADALERIGLGVFASSANFLLVRLPRGGGADLAAWLERHLMLVRRCDSFRGLGDSFIRVSVQAPESSMRLATLIEAWLARGTS